MADIKLDILTPLGPKRDGVEVPGVEIPGIEGEMGVLPLHEALITAVVPGVIRFREGAKSTRIAVGAGFLEVKESGRVIVLVERALEPDEIDVEKAKRDRDEAKKNLDAYTGAIGTAEHTHLLNAHAWAEARIKAAAPTPAAN
jgi:F-type H+-transporting ATPase subunit epsilon